MIREENGHTVACNKERVHEVAAFAAYKERWPKYCKYCHASGVIHEHNYPYEPDWDSPCDYCVCENHCPRCGTHGSLDETGIVCYSCFWCYGDQQALPPYVREECTCFDFYEDQIENRVYEDVDFLDIGEAIF